MDPGSDSKEIAHPMDVSGNVRPWSAWRRLGLLMVFIATLPFTWGETASCNGPSTAYTGYEQMTKESSSIIAYVFIFGTPVLLGFGQYLVRPAWARLGFDFAATVVSAFGAFYCFLSAAIAGSLFTRTSRFYPAPWVATVAVFAMTVDAFLGAIHHLMTMLLARRKRNAAVDRPADPPADG